MKDVAYARHSQARLLCAGVDLCPWTLVSLFATTHLDLVSYCCRIGRFKHGGFNMWVEIAAESDWAQVDRMVGRGTA